LNPENDKLEKSFEFWNITFQANPEFYKELVTRYPKLIGTKNE